MKIDEVLEKFDDAMCVIYEKIKDTETWEQSYQWFAYHYRLRNLYPKAVALATSTNPVRERDFEDARDYGLYGDMKIFHDTVIEVLNENN